MATSLFVVRESRLIRIACFRRLQPPRFFSSATSGTTLTTVSLASPGKAPCAIFTWRCSFAHNSCGGHRALDIDDAIPGMARTVRASQENRSLDTPFLVLRLCYRRCRLLDAVPPVRTGCRALGYCGRAVHFPHRQVPPLRQTGAPRYSPLAVVHQRSRRHCRAERREKVCPAGLV